MTIHPTLTCKLHTCCLPVPQGLLANATATAVMGCTLTWLLSALLHQSMRSAWWHHALVVLACPAVVMGALYEDLASPFSVGGFIYVSNTGQSVEQVRHNTVPVTMASVWEAVCKGVSPQVLSNFLVLGLPGGVMMAADACSFDVTTVMASILGETSPPHLLQNTPPVPLCKVSSGQ